MRSETGCGTDLSHAVRSRVFILSGELSAPTPTLPLDGCIQHRSILDIWENQEFLLNFFTILPMLSHRCRHTDADCTATHILYCGVDVLRNLST